MPKLEKLWEKNRREMNDKLYDIIITKDEQEDKAQRKVKKENPRKWHRKL